MPDFYSLKRLTVKAFQLISNGDHVRKKKKRIDEINKKHSQETTKNENSEKKEINDLMKGEAASQKKEKDSAFEKQYKADIEKIEQKMDRKLTTALNQMMKSKGYVPIAKKNPKEQLRNRIQSQKTPIAYIKKEVKSVVVVSLD